MFRKFYALLLLMLATPIYADFCPCATSPTNFSLIQIGDPLTKILKTCCAPTARKTYKQEPPVPQKWTYAITAPQNPANAVQGSVELIVTFDETQKVINLTVNAQSLTSTNCGNTSTVSFATNTPNTIQVGDTMKAVKATCGKPQFIQKGVAQENTPATPLVTELQYAGPPPVTLVFENGVLKEIQK